MSKKSNEERAKWRARCRQRLAEHIGEKLGCSFGPTDVRLVTGSDDPYVWTYPQQHGSLFQKQLSNHSTGAYVKLIGEVGKTIHAVPASVNKTTEAASRASDAVASDTARIQQLEGRYWLLERDLARVVEESIQWQLQAAEALQLKSSAEAQLAIVEAELHSARVVIQDLRCQLAASSSAVQESTVREACSVDGMGEILGRSQNAGLR
ncbi:hypothetical protein E8E11_000780 [Didymella keratinophila]|nr:hypothetical protein E8E11_000780 [Didymella keratinophila]